jgi:hypothetical protein
MVDYAPNANDIKVGEPFTLKIAFTKFSPIILGYCSL